MFGKKVINAFPALFARRRIAVFSTFFGVALIVVTFYAIHDIVSVATKQDESARSSALRAELSDFLLATRTDDGQSLFDDARQFSAANRPLRATVSKKPFFEYLLRTGNARTVSSQSLDWNPPQACVTQFPIQEGTPVGAAFSLQSCLAAVDNDPSGRYIYFSFKYPTPSIYRHRRGASPTDADYIRLTFQGRRSRGLYLVFETPVLAEKRYPSQIARFAGIHEVTAYGLNGELVRSVNAQAYEKATDNGPSYVTVVGRMDASDLLAEGGSAWPGPEIANLRLAIEIAHPTTAGATPQTLLTLKSGVPGMALVSVEQAYSSNIKSLGRLEVRQRGQLIWDSSQTEGGRQSASPGLIQRLSNWWTEILVYVVNSGTPRPVTVAQRLGRDGAIAATLTSSSHPLPDVVSRAFLWLTVGLLLILGLAFFWFSAVGRLRHVARIAASMVNRSNKTSELQRYRGDGDEVGDLARIIYVLARRFHARGRRLVYQQYNGLKADQERLKWRHSALEAIGHEIKSPLQSLLTMRFDNPSVHVKLERMSRAVEALYWSASVESGLNNGQVIIKTGDLSEYLAQFANNVRGIENDVTYLGADTGVLANFDAINLEQVLEHVIDNARRLKAAGTTIEIDLDRRENSVLISIFNHGSEIEGDPEHIFQYGSSQSDLPENLGQGLFASRSYLRAMKGSISARNARDGVVVLIELPGVVPSGTAG